MKIRWVDTNRRLCLAAREVYHGAPDDWNWVTEDVMVEVAEWCSQNNCGRRISYDMIQFKTKKEMSLFLLRWA